MYVKTVINITTCKWGADQHSTTIARWFKHHHKQSRPLQNWPEKSSGGRAVWCTRGTALSGCGPRSLQGTYPPSHTCQHTERITPSYLSTDRKNHSILPVNTQKESLHLNLSTHRKNHSIFSSQHTERITPSLPVNTRKESYLSTHRKKSLYLHLATHRKNHSIFTCQHTERITLSTPVNTERITQSLHVHSQKDHSSCTC